MLEVALLFVNLVWIYKLCKHRLYTQCVLFALCPKVQSATDLTGCDVCCTYSRI